MDPVRPFISGHVANSMAAEVIDLLHSLLTAPESSTAQTWADAVQRVSLLICYLYRRNMVHCFIHLSMYFLYSEISIPSYS